MATRRLVIVMLVLLGASTIAAALAPVPQQSERETTTTASAPAPGGHGGGELVRATVDADAHRPEIVRIAPGDQLALAVRSGRFAEVEIRELGLLDDAAPLAPARFDILARRSGRYDVRRREPRARLATIVVGRPKEPATSGSRRRAGRSAGTSR